MSKDKFGDRMKDYEGKTSIRLMPRLPTFARVDGRAFHSFTRGMERPYDTRMTDAMTLTAHKLAVETNARMVYTQSDEITLMWYEDSPASQIWFDGKHSKMVSQIAALATLHFYRACVQVMPDYAEKLPSFDGRVWQVPTIDEAVNVFMWREWDATKNSITMAARQLFSDKELMHKNSSDKQIMMFERGVNWNDYPAYFKRGTYIQRHLVQRPFTTMELESLPPQHMAHQNPNLVVERTEFRVPEMPPLSQIVNRAAVIFDGAEPELAGNMRANGE